MPQLSSYCLLECFKPALRGVLGVVASRVVLHLGVCLKELSRLSGCPNCLSFGSVFRSTFEVEWLHALVAYWLQDIVDSVWKNQNKEEFGEQWLPQLSSILECFQKNGVTGLALLGVVGRTSNEEFAQQWLPQLSSILECFNFRIANKVDGVAALVGVFLE